MKKIILIFALIINFSSFAQDEDAVVYFKDKPNAAAALANPLSILTQRSLDRRTMQNIALDIKDAPIHQPYYDQINATSGFVVLAKSKWLNCVCVRGTVASIQALSGLSFVDSVKFFDNTLNFTTNLPNNNAAYKFKKINKTMQPETVFNYGNSFNQISMLNGHILHQQNFTGTGKIIAVLDSGFPNVNTTQPFERIMTNNQVLGGYDFVNKSNDYFSGHFHGTWVLSCIAGFTDNQLVGTAPDAQYYLYITEDVDTENPVEEANWVEAAEEADRVGVDVITSSLGYFGYDNPAYSHDYSDMIGDKNYASRGANIAFSRGIIVVASAGNAGGTAEPHVGVPAEATNVLAIGAVKGDRTRAAFSSIGPSFDNRIKPDFMAQGQGSTVANTAGNIQLANGTSFSGPIMAGMITSFWQAVPNLTNQQVIDLLKQSSDNFNTPNGLLGYGIPNFQTALSLSNSNFENINRKIFALYPNPVGNQLEVSFPSGFTTATINLFNTIGQNIAIYEVTNSSKILNTSDLSSGVYMYKIESNNQIQTGKLVKN